MAELGIYEACKQGNHVRKLVKTTYTDTKPAFGSYSYMRTETGTQYYWDVVIGWVGCARQACTCLCHSYPGKQWENGRTSGPNSYQSIYSNQIAAIEREVAGFLEPDDAPLTFPPISDTLEP